MAWDEIFLEVQENFKEFNMCSWSVHIAKTNALNSFGGA